jgi:hypothetical protein
LSAELGGVFAAQTHLVVNGPLVLLIAGIPRVNGQPHLPILPLLNFGEMILCSNLAGLNQLAERRTGAGGMVSAYELIVPSMGCWERL